MRLLIIECGDNKLPAAIYAAADKLRPKPDTISTMNLDVTRLNVPEFKNILSTLAPDTIVLDPPQEVIIDTKWVALLKEVTRHVEMLSGRILFVSSVEVLGDAQLRTEAAAEMPYSEIGMFLQVSETTIEEATSRCYIVRFPYLADNLKVKQWFTCRPQASDNEFFTLAMIEDVAQTIIDRVQTGWFGKYHATPNDSIMLSNLIDGDWNDGIRVPDRSLQSKYNWKMTASRTIWSKINP